MLKPAKLFALVNLLLLAGCTALIPAPTAPPGIAGSPCRALYQHIDRRIAAAGVRDQSTSPVPGFPYLRTSRLLASFNDEMRAESPGWHAWIGHMANLDARGREAELRNLPRPATEQSHHATLADLNRCRERLIATELVTPAQHARLRAAARVPDDYVTGWRVLGVYPVTAPLVSVGISAWHRRTRAAFATSLSLLPQAGTVTRWRAQPSAPTAASLPEAPLTTRQIQAMLAQSRDPLGIPVPPAADRERLFVHFAPIWEIDVVDHHDYPGKVGWDKGPTVDITQPTLYRKVSHTRLGGQVLLQLNYIVWFPARPGNDLFAGQLDGIIWRVTLGPDGKPWLYDSIHNCGCYHQFFLSDRLRLRGDLPRAYFEAPLLPQPAPPRTPVVIRIAHSTHYIQRVYPAEGPSARSVTVPASRKMRWEDYDTLRSLPVEQGFRSLFGAHGLIPGTERAERFLLWPMGIRSPGAMRQWGRHATAFNGRRHFDDAFLLETLFEPVP
ncbi:hypothetical protein [Marinobacter sp. X15-166B]|uniref:hypothetical protein n=1 Tax=Marinobacter sp. X15-166B TaxID=1897620 RepID=UPI00085C21FC|nr:hypothetical protein [Marinobacter sp. X15-166B]OEY65421.1 hypothetical protein BG841_02425 [Marinobacter sp. X15-166B]